MSLDTALLQTADNKGVRTIALNRPAARNALSMALMEALIQELQATHADP